MNAFTLLPLSLFRRDDSARTIPARAGRRVFTLPHTPLFSELDRLFEGLFSNEVPRGLAPETTKDMGRAMLRPNLDISGDDTRYFVTVELPGVDENDLHVEVEDNMLVIRGEKNYESRSGSPKALETEAGKDATRELENIGGPESSKRNFYRIERSYGSFQRSLALPEDVDSAAITAKHKDGVLTITLPRKEELLPESRRIAVNKA